MFPSQQPPLEMKNTPIGREIMRNEFSIMVDETQVDGVITNLSSRLLDVEITKPYSRFSSCLSIPLFAAPYSSFLRDDYGLCSAELLLRKLYADLKVLHENLPRTQHLFAAFKQAATDCEAAGMTESDFAELKKASRQLIRAGQRTPAEHQQLLTDTRPVVRQTEAAVWALEQQLTRDVLGNDIGNIDLIRQVLVFLEGLTKQ